MLDACRYFCVVFLLLLLLLFYIYIFQKKKFVYLSFSL
jgi:hypothetical protein